MSSPGMDAGREAATDAAPFAAMEDVPVYRALLHLARELWVVKDRQRVIESWLEKQGFVPKEAVEWYEPSAEEREALEVECRNFVRDLVAELGIEAVRERK